MKSRIITLLSGVVVVAATACTEYNEPADFQVGATSDIESVAYLKDYKTLKSYINRSASPNFKLGASVSGAEFAKHGASYITAKSNFDEITPISEMKYSSIVGDDGAMSFTGVETFVNAAKEAEMPIFGHVLCSHDQQNLTYLNSLIAPTIIPGTEPEKPSEPTLETVEYITNGNFEGDDLTTSFYYTNLAAELTADGEGAGDKGRAYAFTNTESKPNVYDAQIMVRLPEGKCFEVGKSYKFSMDIRSKDFTGDIITHGKGPDLTTFIYGQIMGKVSVSPEWSTFEYILTPTEGHNSTKCGVVALNLGKILSTIYIDNVSLTTEEMTGGAPDTEIVIKNVVTNGDCEIEDQSSFLANGASGSDVTGAFGAEGSGSDGVGRCYNVTNPKVQAKVFDAQLKFWMGNGSDIVLEAGKSYTFKVDMKADVAGVQIASQAHTSPTPSFKEGSTLGVHNISTEWATYEHTIKITDKNTGCSTFTLNFGTTAATVSFDNISILTEVEQVATPDEGTPDIVVPMEPEEMDRVLSQALEEWTNAMFATTGDYVEAWDVINEPMSDSNPSELKSQDNEADESRFYWQEYLGKDYARKAVAYARAAASTAGVESLTLFVNEYGLESADKCKGLCDMISYWESDGTTKIDGIGTQMHISFEEDTDTQAANEAAIVEMFKQLAATGKLIKISELDMGYVDVYGDTLYTDDLNEEQHKAMSAFYTFILTAYFENVSPAQQYGVTQNGITDSAVGASWRAGEPIGLWDTDYNRKHTYAGFVEGLEAMK